MNQPAHNREVTMRRYFMSFLLIIALASPAAAGVSVLGGLTYEMTLKPGGEYEGTIQLLNSGDEPAQVRIFQTDYSFFSDGRTYYGEPGTTPRSNAGWLNVSPSRVTIPPKETVSIYYVAKAPDDPALTGTYWSVIMIEPLAETGSPNIKSQDGKVTLGLQTVIRYAVQIITNIGETGNSAMRLADNRLLHRDGKTILQADIENVGDRWMSPAVYAEFYDKDGRSVGRYESGKQRVFPSCSVRHLFDLTAVPVGSYTALFVFDNGDDRVFGATYEVRLQK